MKKNLTILLTLLTSLLFAQSFEGEIVYTHTYKSKSMMVSDDQLGGMMGTKENYYLKDGQYKSVTNGSLVSWQLYVSKENKVYTKMESANVVYWQEASVNDDVVSKVEVNKEVTTILGYKCDEVILTCKSGVQKFYFNSKLSVDAKLFVNHKYGNWYAYLQKANAVPLKEVLDSPQFSMESVATEIKPGKLDNKLFVLDPGVKAQKSPY